ncbi:MAG TPA: hypothetical protein VKV26_14450 [Dehalococcoidia bacterium]|nr:hypothetical protein [Dehalococcoidia bacterium]
MTDMEFIRMRQAEGRGERPKVSATLPRPAPRLAALMRLARQPAGPRPAGDRRRQA